MLWLSITLLVFGLSLEGLNVHVLRILSESNVAREPSPVVLIPLVFSITGTLTINQIPILVRLAACGLLLFLHVLLVFILPGKYDPRNLPIE